MEKYNIIKALSFLLFGYWVGLVYPPFFQLGPSFYGGKND
jgi:hypothetical protein